jgi:hypothetical protein
MNRDYKTEIKQETARHTFEDTCGAPGMVEEVRILHTTLEHEGLLWQLAQKTKIHNKISLIVSSQK